MELRGSLSESRDYSISGSLSGFSSPCSDSSGDLGRVSSDISDSQCSTQGWHLPSKPLPIRNLNHISIVCENVEESASFFRDTLGFVDVKRPSSFNFHGAWLWNYGIGIHIIQGTPVPRPSAINPKADHLSFQADDIDEVEAHLQLRGVKYCKQAVCEGPVLVRQLFFHSPENLMIEVCNCELLDVVPIDASAVLSSTPFPSAAPAAECVVLSSASSAPSCSVSQDLSTPSASSRCSAPSMSSAPVAAPAPPKPVDESAAAPLMKALQLQQQQHLQHQRQQQHQQWELGGSCGHELLEVVPLGAPVLSSASASAPLQPATQPCWLALASTESSYVDPGAQRNPRQQEQQRKLGGSCDAELLEGPCAEQLEQQQQQRQRQQQDHGEWSGSRQPRRIFGSTLLADGCSRRRGCSSHSRAPASASCTCRRASASGGRGSSPSGSSGSTGGSGSRSIESSGKSSGNGSSSSSSSVPRACSLACLPPSSRAATTGATLGLFPSAWGAGAASGVEPLGGRRWQVLVL